MTKIINQDTNQSREATIITKPAGEGLNWCMAVWPEPKYGRTKVDGNGHGWQFVRLQDNGTYSFNGTMMGGIFDSLEDARAWAEEKGMAVI